MKRLRKYSFSVSSPFSVVHYRTIQSSMHTCCEYLCMLMNQHSRMIKPRKLGTPPSYLDQIHHAHHQHKWPQSPTRQLFDKHPQGSVLCDPILKHQVQAQLQQSHRPFAGSSFDLHPKTDHLSKEISIQLLSVQRMVFITTFEIRLLNSHLTFESLKKTYGFKK